MLAYHELTKPIQGFLATVNAMCAQLVEPIRQIEREFQALSVQLLSLPKLPNVLLPRDVVDPSWRIPDRILKEIGPEPLDEDSPSRPIGFY